MEVVFLNSFKRDLKKIKDKKLKQKIKAVLLKLEEGKSLEEIKNVAKISGCENCYRIRLGNYRFGMYWEDETIILAHFLKRNDIYKVFP